MHVCSDELEWGSRIWGPSILSLESDVQSVKTAEEMEFITVKLGWFAPSEMM